MRRVPPAFYNRPVMYSTELLDHFQNPRNAGDLAEPDALAQVENPACGDVLRLTLKVSDNRITGAAFKAKGCVPTIACGSALTSLIIGKTLHEARRLSRTDVSVAVGSVAAGLDPRRPTGD